MRPPARSTATLGLALGLALACEHRRTAVVVVVDTNMLQGPAAPPPGAPSRYRLTRLTATVKWGPAQNPTEDALSDRYDVRVGARNDLDAAVPQVRLPYPVFYLQSPDPSAPRWVRVAVRAEALDESGAAVPLGPFERETRFVEGVTHTQVIYLDDRCVGRACPAGQTCGLGGGCIPITREPPGASGGPGATNGGDPKSMTGTPGARPCPEGAGLCFDSRLDGGARGDGGADGGRGDGNDGDDAGGDGAAGDAGAGGDAGGDAGAGGDVACVFAGACEDGGGGDAGMDARADVDPLAAGVCVPPMRRDEQHDEATGGGACNGLRGAFTARGINVGYYPFRLLVAVPHVYDVRSGVAEGERTIEEVPENALIALASTGPNYSARCQVDAGVVRVCCPTSATGYCDDDTSACLDDRPPLRAPRAVPGERPFAFWGYVPRASGERRLGWFLLPPNAVIYDGRGPGEATGPGGNEFEVDGCGTYLRPARARRCRDVNRCDEGHDGCQLCPGDACRRQVDPALHRSDVVRARSGTDDSPWGPYLRWAAHSSPKGWLRWGDRVQVYYRTRDRDGDWWAYVEVLRAPGSALAPTAASDVSRCNAAGSWRCDPCGAGGTCGWVDGRYLEAAVFADGDGC